MRRETELKRSSQIGREEVSQKSASFCAVEAFERELELVVHAEPGKHTLRITGFTRGKGCCRWSRGRWIQE
jgi:hypothetical protein